MIESGIAVFCASLAACYCAIILTPARGSPRGTHTAVSIIGVASIAGMICGFSAVMVGIAVRVFA